LYGTEEALEVLEALEDAYADYAIIDPGNLGAPGARPCIDKGHCRQCMDDRMWGYFFPAIERCEVFAFWAPIATCNIECELRYAWQLGKEILHVSYQLGEIDLEDMTLEDYHYIRVMTEVS